VVVLGPSPLSTHLQTPSDGAVNISDLSNTTVTILERPIPELPIKTLFHNSEAEFSELLSKQSTTFEMAASEYLQRYQRDPQPGFEVKRRLDNVRDSGPLMSHCQSSAGAAQAGCKILGGELLRLLHEPELSPYLPEIRYAHQCIG
jgi:hypothetical protein